MFFILFAAFVLVKNKSGITHSTTNSLNNHEDLTTNETQSTEPLDAEKPDRHYLSQPKDLSKTEAPQIQTLQEAIVLSAKALRTKSENDVYQQALQDKEKLDLAAAVIANVQEPSSDVSLLNDQKDRMDAVLFLTRALEWKQNPQNTYIQSTIKTLVLDNAIEKAKDHRLKKSLAADRIELYANLKSIDAKAGDDIKQNAKNPVTIKIIQFASNFYQLDQKKKGHL